MAIQKIGHVGIYAKDLDNMRRFYSDIVGLTIADEDLNLGAVFMTSDPEREHHEFVLFRSKGEETCVQQLSFSCESPQDIVSYYQRFKENGVRFDLSSGSVRAEALPDESVLRKLWGGQALATYYLMRELPVDATPFGPENVISLWTGPVSGTGLVPGATKTTGVYLSPATGYTLGRG